ncbi:MAG: sulfatase [Verrucomicrobia bacterium]|nr:sulfatase [Verrucomicrobiota bacterium]MBM3864771.1 sulfatase [Verrucomicrobiota bacterium]
MRLLASLFLGSALTAAAASPGRPPNVLFLASDDLRDNLGCLGDPVARTPHLDALARRGVLFERAYCQQALCNPSRASLLTGRRPDTLRVWNLPTHFRETLPDVVTLPQHFLRHGYFTRNIGKIFHNFRTRIQGDPASWSVPAELHFASHAADVAVLDGGTAPPNLAQAKGAEARDVPDEAYFDGRVAARAVEALRAASRRPEPFFLAVGFWKPHTPFNPPKRYWDLYRRGEIPPIRHPGPPRDTPAVALKGANELSPGTREAMAELRHGYYAATSYLDAQVGKVLAELDRLGLDGNTIVVFWSDHGFHLGEHGLWGKTSNRELDARVPLIITAPGVARAGSRTRSLAELLDLFPTLVDLCGLPTPAGLEGASLRPVLADPSARVKDAAFTQTPRPANIQGGRSEIMGYSLRDDRHRYTEWRAWSTGDLVEAELYDLAQDPGEDVNLAVEPARAPVLASLAARLARQFPRRPLPAEPALP